MGSTPVPDELTHYSSRREVEADALAWPVFSEPALDLLRSVGEVLHPEPGEVLWDAGDPYALYLVLSGGVPLLDRRDDRVVFDACDRPVDLDLLEQQRFGSGVSMGRYAVRREGEEPLPRGGSRNKQVSA